jgi:thymidine kinase
MRTGELHLILGPMFSGKTTKLIEISASFEDIAIINYAGDVRYHPTLLSTHDKKMVPCIQTHELLSILRHTNIIFADAIFINEGQFFPDIFEAVKHLVEDMGKKVFVCGLDGDFLRRPFGDIHRLIPLCDSLVKLKARCERCARSALFSHRIIADREQVVIGSDEYIPICRDCYVMLNRENSK